VKRDGNLYEQIFFAEALKHGLEVFPPLGDYLPIDCLVMNSAGRVFKVQIKGTSKVTICPKNKGSGRYKITASCGSLKKQPLDCTKVDVLAAFIEDLELWYLIPCMSLDNALTLGLYPNIPDSKGKHEKFRENWDLFKTT
jgi:hypothetical protein